MGKPISVDAKIYMHTHALSVTSHEVEEDESWLPPEKGLEDKNSFQMHCPFCTRGRASSHIYDVKCHVLHTTTLSAQPQIHLMYEYANL